MRVDSTALSDQPYCNHSSTNATYLSSDLKIWCRRCSTSSWCDWFPPLQRFFEDGNRLFGVGNKRKSCRLRILWCSRVLRWERWKIKEIRDRTKWIGSGEWIWWRSTFVCYFPGRIKGYYLPSTESTFDTDIIPSPFRKRRAWNRESRCLVPSSSNKV